jgi:hypothetical protein
VSDQPEELVEVAREERVAHFIETYYRATAEVFEFRHGEPAAGVGGGKRNTAAALMALPKIGIPLLLTRTLSSALTSCTRGSQNARSTRRWRRR